MTLVATRHAVLWFTSTRAPARRVDKPSRMLSANARHFCQAEMALAIDLIVKAKGWDQQRTAEELTIAASDVSDLLRGKLARSAESDAVA